MNGDTSGVLSGAPSLTTTATSTSAPGSYSITVAVGTLTASNYTFSFVNGTLTVTAATQTISFTTPVKPCDLWCFADLFKCDSQFRAVRSPSASLPVLAPFPSAR